VGWCGFSIWKPTSGWVEFLRFGRVWCEFYCGFLTVLHQNQNKKTLVLLVCLYEKRDI
jgi:hypothetical protein